MTANPVDKLDDLADQVAEEFEAYRQPDEFKDVSLENPLYALESKEFVLDVHEWYMSYIRRTATNVEGQTYYLFDNIHRIDRWVNQVQSLLSQTDSVHVVATLPVEVSSLNEFDRPLYQTRSILLPPKFYDFAQIEGGVAAIEKENNVYPIRRALANQRDVDLSTVIDECLMLQKQLQAENDDLPSIVDEYLFNSGLRDVDGQGLSTIKERLQLTLYRDVQQFYAVDDPGDLYTLCVLVAQESVREYQFGRLTEQLNTDRRTIRKYLDILQDFLILSPSYKWGYQRHRSLRMYLRDPRYVSALNLLANEEIQRSTDEHRRSLVHSVVYDHLRRLAFYFNDYTDIEMPVRYWEENGETVEYVLDVEGKPLPIALTTRRGEDATIEAVKACIDETEAAHGVVAGNDIKQPYAADEQVFRLPLWMLLYIC